MGNGCTEMDALECQQDGFELDSEMGNQCRNARTGVLRVCKHYQEAIGSLPCNRKVVCSNP